MILSLCLFRLIEGYGSSFLPILNFCIFSYSKEFASIFKESKFENANLCNLVGIFEILKSKFDYYPKINLRDFFAKGNTKSKIEFLIDLIGFIKKKVSRISTKREQDISQKGIKTLTSFRSSRSFINSKYNFGNNINHKNLTNYINNALISKERTEDINFLSSRSNFEEENKTLNEFPNTVRSENQKSIIQNSYENQILMKSSNYSKNELSNENL